MSINPPALTAEIETALRRYLAIQQEEKRLKEEKSELQAQLAQHLAGYEAAKWPVAVDGQRLVVRKNEVTSVAYDEAVLRERLGERYVEVLAPDSKRLREHLPAALECLRPILPAVGKPERERVKAAIEAGTVTPAEFAGAFTKETRTRISVAPAHRAE